MSKHYHISAQPTTPAQNPYHFKKYTFDEVVKEQREGIVLEWKISKLMSPEQIQQTKNDLNTERGKQPYWL